MNDDFFGEFRRTNEPVSQYWRDVKAALDVPLSAKESLRDGFWPRSRFISSEIDRFQEDGTLSKEFATDVPYVGHRGDCLAESFRVERDVYVGYFLAIRPTNEGTSHPFWIAIALLAPNSDPSHSNSIQMQYWTPASIHNFDAETYVGWDSTNGNIWLEDRRFTRAHTDCIMGTWHFRVQEGIVNPQMRIPVLQIANIKATLERFEAEDGGGSPSLHI